MPHKRSNSPYYKINITLPGYGKTGVITTKTTKKRQARKMEHLLRDIAERGWYDLIDAVTGPDRKVSLPQLMKASNENRLRALRKNLDDPTIEEAVEEYRPHEDYRRAENGLDQLLELAPPEKRLSWLDGKQITKMGRKMINDQGYKPNSVKTSLYLGVRKLLRFHLGREEAERIYGNVQLSSEDDSRVEWLTEEEIERVLSECDPLFRRWVATLLTTGIDRGPSIALKARDVDLDAGTMFVRDTKTQSRQRTLDLSEATLRQLRPLVEGKEGDEKVFPFSYHQVRHHWESVREAAGVEWCRIKDLRHTFAVHYYKNTRDLIALQQRLGHKNLSTTLRYAKHATGGNSEDVHSAAQSMGLTDV